jgi:hypothetical protein
MSTAKRDSSEFFSSVALQLGTKKATVYDNSFHLSPSGVTFKTDTSLPTWTEVDMKLQLPVEKSPSAKTIGAKKIGCRGVVVQCKKQSKGGAYNVALLFCGLSPRAQQQLRAASKQFSPSA